MRWLASCWGGPGARPSRAWPARKMRCAARGANWTLRRLRQAANKLAQVSAQAVEVALHPREVRRLLEGLLVHIQTPVKFDVQAVPVSGGLADAGHQRHALKVIVARHTVAT